MAYILGNSTLPKPVGFARETIEVATQNLLLSGETRKKTITRKERFVLEFRRITQAEADNIFSEYDLMAARDFSVNEDNLSISSTPVLVDIPSREYTTKGVNYLENLILVLTEIT